MYLVERLIGVFTFVLIMFLMCFWIYKSDKSKIKKILKIYWIILALLAFLYIPAKSADLSRYIYSAHLYSSYSFNELIELLSQAKVPGQILYFYLLGLTKIDGLIPAVSCMIFYGFAFSMLNDAVNRFDLKPKSIALSLLFFMEMGGFLSVISVIRCFIAFAAIAYCCYFELIANKSFIKHIPLYLFASSMHPAAMALTFFRIVTILLKKEKVLIKRFINAFLVGIMVLIIIKFGNQYISLILDKTDTYVNGHVYSYVWEYIISWLYMIFSTFFLLKIKIDDVENKMFILNYKNFILLINLVILLFNFEYSIFTRFQLFSSILFLPYFALGVDYCKKTSKLLSILFIFISLTIFIVACTRGNLCGYKFLLFDF